MISKKPTVFITRKLPEKVETRMMELFNATLNDSDKLLTEEELIKVFQQYQIIVPSIADKISKGKISKFLNDNSLLNQLWIMDPKKKVSDILKENSFSTPLQVIDFIRYKVGEGV